MGIEQTEKLIMALRSLDIKALLEIDLDVVYAEMADLDKQEALKIADDIFHLLLSVMSTFSFIDIATSWTKIVSIFMLLAKVFRK